MKKLGIALIAGLLASHAMAGKETKIELSEVPEKVMETAKRAMPGATFVSANTEVEDNGYKVYEIQGNTTEAESFGVELDEGEVLTFEIDIDDDNKVEEIEVVLSEELLPGAVMKAINEKYEGFEPEFIEASMSDSKKVMKYEVVGKHGGKKLDLEVSASGRKIVESDD